MNHRYCIGQNKYYNLPHLLQLEGDGHSTCRQHKASQPNPLSRSNHHRRSGYLKIHSFRCILRELQRLLRMSHLRQHQTSRDPLHPQSNRLHLSTYRLHRLQWFGCLR